MIKTIIKKTTVGLLTSTGLSNRMELSRTCR